MRIISLIPLTKHAKQVIKQHGERWEVIHRRATVLFTDRSGPWLYVQPLTEERALPTTVAEAKVDSAAQWVHEFQDNDFKVSP